MRASMRIPTGGSAAGGPVRRRKSNFKLSKLFVRCPRVLTAISVAYFAFVGLAIRVGIYLLLRRLDFGVTTTEPYVLEGARRRCHLPSSGAGYFVQNVVGCMVMAAVARHKKAMNEHLAVGLASGLCGSLTTFATWMGEVAITFMNGYTFQAFISVLCMLCVSLSSYRFGHFLAGCGMGDEPRCFDDFCGLRTLYRHVCPDPRRRAQRRSRAAALREDESDESSGTASPSASESGADAGNGAVPVHSVDVARESGAEEEEEGAEGADKVPAESVDDLDWGLAMDTASDWGETDSIKPVTLDPSVEFAIVFLAFCGVILYIGLCAGLGYDAGLLDLAYAPAGALLRWYLSLWNPTFAPMLFGLPVMTLAANTLGCVCNAFPAVLAERTSDYAGRLAIEAISTGFAGCLSTVSTLIGELRSDTLGGLRVRILYFLLSFGLAMAVELPILTARC